ncbi:ABC transporter permease subunit [Egibacter rhizosphaerae]|uniref:ABC transporter permease subunit n=1 Tax=Egibacter rhizosphaerae TaxID=1670831 RepID=A0A411YKM9_9ACTN|nr:ABC transporter permease subunit [Egibacter rhizosphaerae]QBI21752.1 ABC transporter permease subunit [Egibacter rhizosphaerae]
MATSAEDQRNRVEAPAARTAEPFGAGPPAGPLGRRTRLRNRWRVFRQTFGENWLRFKKNRIGVVGLVLIVVFALMAVLHPILMTTVWEDDVYDPVTGHSAQEYEVTVVEEAGDIEDAATQLDLERVQLRHDPTAQVGDTVMIDEQPAPPSFAHPLGTDPLGRDVMSQLMFGAQIAFAMAAVAAITTVGLATLVGAIAAYYRGWTETVSMRIADLFLLLPAVPFLVFISAIYGINVVTLGLIFGIVSGLGPTAILLKSQALAVSVKPFIDAAKIAGASSRQVVFRHVIPNVLPLSFLSMMFTVSGAISAEAILSAFGLIDVPMSWGIMIQTADTAGYILRGFDFWWLLFPAGLAVTLLAFAFYLFGRGLDEVVNPRLRQN